jgi:hypothetical protein
MAEEASLKPVHRCVTIPVVCFLLVNHVLGGIRLSGLPSRIDYQPGTAICRCMPGILRPPLSAGWKSIFLSSGDSTKEDRARAVVNELMNMKPYNASYDLLNGTKWVYQKKYKGNPFLAQEYWPTAVLVYRGIRYTGLNINYDLYTDKLILLYAEDNGKKYFVLSNDYLESFSFTDTLSQNEHIYEYFNIPGTEGKDLYEKVYDGETALIIRPRCEIRFEKSGMYLGEYVRSYDYYVRVGDTYVPFQSKRTLLHALQRNIPELKKFIRKNRLKINKLRPDHIVSVLKYFDALS